MPSIPIETCVLFLGAGVHAPPPPDSGYEYPESERPLLGGDLARKLADECDFRTKFPNESPCDLQRVSLDYETENWLGRKKLVDQLETHLQTGRKPSPALRMLAALPFKIIVTTNYDRLLEAALRRVGKDPKVLVYGPDPTQVTADMTLDPTSERPLVFKMHGDLDQRDSIVITDEDYIRFVQRMSDKGNFHPVPETVMYRMSRWTTLVLGYSLRDYNLRLLFRTLRWKKDEADLPPSLSVDRSPDLLIKRVYEESRPKLINFVIEDLWAFVPALYREITGRTDAP
jgi:hypothetical protein